ncbi:MAG: formate dehydrogenase accessory sulfurtransferase FdhD [Pseudomonadota bacterium]
MMTGARRVRSLKRTTSKLIPHIRHVPEEVPCAFVYNGTTHAVMLASPTDLEAFALGFTLSEGIATSRQDIESVEIVTHDAGIELRLWLTTEPADQLASRRRFMAGPTGCGLCGIESLEAAIPHCPKVPAGLTTHIDEIAQAVAALAPAQALNRQTYAVHAAGFWTRDEGLVAIAEDVGRHNALDKLIGHLVPQGTAFADGILVMTSRVSVELIQKAARVGMPVIAAVSAPTHLAIMASDAAGMTLVAIARDDAFEVFTHGHRIRDLRSVAACESDNHGA